MLADGEGGGDSGEGGAKRGKVWGGGRSTVPGNIQGFTCKQMVRGGGIGGGGGKRGKVWGAPGQLHLATPRDLHASRW